MSLEVIVDLAGGGEDSGVLAFNTAAASASLNLDPVVRVGKNHSVKVLFRGEETDRRTGKGSEEEIYNFLLHSRGLRLFNRVEEGR